MYDVLATHIIVFWSCHFSSPAYYYLYNFISRYISVNRFSSQNTVYKCINNVPSNKIIVLYVTPLLIVSHYLVMAITIARKIAPIAIQMGLRSKIPIDITIVKINSVAHPIQSITVSKFISCL